ncbi:MAG: aldo/keto reductase [Magnetococcales bacterium]|nr:aldo/keto reductase [Magnetococcales bacterium]
MKLGLGTVQFGMEYGITNREGQPGLETVRAILAEAALNGVRVLDTACQYGASESVLGAALPGNHSFHIVTKTPFFPVERITRREGDLLTSTFLQSLQNLRTDSVYGLLIHSARDLLKPGADFLINAMLELQKSGKIIKIGVSVYAPSELLTILERFPLDLAQTPVNLLDQRWLDGDNIARLRASGVEMHARSVFLQGILLSDPDALPPFFTGLRPHLTALRAAIRERNLTPLEAALGFVRDLDWVDVLLCGVTTVPQLCEITQAMTARFDSAFLRPFACRDENYTNPSLWVTT